MIKHESFVDICIKDPTLFDRMFETTSFKQLLRNMDTEMSTRYDLFKDTFQTKYNFIGDLFEIFAECFFTVLKSDNRVGIFGYEPTKKTDDNGVDGFGIGIDGKPATVQVKYRGNSVSELKERDIKNFPFQSVKKYKVDIDTKTNMVIFTSSAGLNWYSESNVFDNSMRVINHEMISKLVDNNQCFWLAVKELLQESKNFYFKKTV